MRGSSDNGDITEKTHILVADFETTPDSEVLGSGIDFFGGTSPDYFVLESDIHVFDRFAATAVLLQPNAIALATTDTLEARTTQVSSGALHGYSGGSVQSISSSGLLNSEKPFANNTAGHKFSGSVTGAGVHSGRSGSYLGSFIQNATATDKVVEMGGHISLTGPNYDASGTFAGAKVP